MQVYNPLQGPFPCYNEKDLLPWLVQYIPVTDFKLPCDTSVHVLSLYIGV